MKKGFTLIEVMAVVAIITFVGAFSLVGWSFYRGLKTEIEIFTILYEIEESLCFGRSYCDSYGVKGKVTIAEVSNGISIDFRAENGYTEDKELRGDLYIERANIYLPKKDDYAINEEGVIQSKKTYFYNNEGDRFQVSINPVVNNIYVGGAK